MREQPTDALIARLDDLDKKIDQRFEKIDQRFDILEDAIRTLGSNQAAFLHTLADVKDRLDARFDALEKRLPEVTR